MMFYIGKDCSPEDIVPLVGTKEFTVRGIICKDIDNIQFKLCYLDFEYFVEEEFQYVFTPIYEEIDKANQVLDKYVMDIFIPGLDLELKKEKYYRANCTPCFIYQRVIPPNRNDIREYLDDIGVRDYFPMEIMFKDYHRHSDGLYVIPNEPSYIKHDIFSVN